MIADTIKFVDGFIGTDRRQFIIPIYQRRYKWTNEQCSRLIDDMLKSASEHVDHFTGAVVYKEKPSGSFKSAFLVDGQQRMTTVILMLKALSLISSKKKDEDKDYKYVFNSSSEFLHFDKKDEDRGFKLIPSKNDATVFNLILSAKTLEELDKNPVILNEKNDLLFNNFKFIYNRFLSEISNGKSIRYDILEGLLALTVVEMSLEPNDDPQEIFESINSLGIKLSNADLIRNYLLMTNDNQKSLFESYWEPIQDDFIGENNMEDFVTNYLLMKKNYAINYADVYKEYVSFSNEWFKGQAINREELLKDLYKVAKIYQPFIRNCINFSADTNMLMQELRDMGQTTAYPFLMKVFLDFDDGKIDEKTLDKVLNLIIVYLVRRTLCGIPTHSLRGFMLTLYNRIFKIKDNYVHYYESVFAFLDTLQTNDSLPTENLVKEKLVTAPIYNSVKFATYLLYKIENGRYPNVYSEFTLTNNPSVEHIMPQTLTEEWRTMLGEDSDNIYQTYIDTLGNLSLSSRPKNSIMGNEPFADKQNILRRDGSKFTVLNRDVLLDTQFTETEILNREARLAGIVLEKYHLDEIDFSGIRFEKSIEIVGTEEENIIFNGATPIAYSLFGKEVSCNSFADILQATAKCMYERCPEIIRELASENYNPWNENGEKAYLHYANGENDKDKVVTEDIRVNTNLNAEYSIQFCTNLLIKCGFEANQLTVILKEDSIKKENTFSKKDRVKTVREALKRLSSEGLVIYDYDNMPKSDEWIKFQTQELNEVFKYDGNLTRWDGEKFKYIAYFEYYVNQHKVFLTVKDFKGDSDTIDLLKDIKESSGLEEDGFGTGYWHIKSYQVDYDKVLNATDKVKELYDQLIVFIPQIKEFLSSLSAKLKEEE